MKQLPVEGKRETANLSQHYSQLAIHLHETIPEVITVNIQSIENLLYQFKGADSTL
jgi:hypothetical protein